MIEKNSSFFDSIPAEKTLDYKYIAPKVNDLIEFYINKIDREFPKHITNGPAARGTFLAFACVAKNTYRSIIFLCDMVSEDPKRRIEYSLSSIPLLRVLLEEVFTMVFFSEDLDSRIAWYHKVGWRETKETYDRFFANFGTDNNWQSWFTKYQKILSGMVTLFGLTAQEVSNPAANIPFWPTPGQMKNFLESQELKDYMDYLRAWFYKTFSQASHLSWSGLAIMGGHFLPTNVEKQEDYLKKSRSDCAFYNTTLMLAFLSELENILKFGNEEKLRYLWTFVSEYWQVTKELYDKRYKHLVE